MSANDEGAIFRLAYDPNAANEDPLGFDPDFAKRPVLPQRTTFDPEAWVDPNAYKGLEGGPSSADYFDPKRRYYSPTAVNPVPPDPRPTLRPKLDKPEQPTLPGINPKHHRPVKIYRGVDIDMNSDDPRIGELRSILEGSGVEQSPDLFSYDKPMNVKRWRAQEEAAHPQRWKRRDYDARPDWEKYVQQHGGTDPDNFWSPYGKPPKATIPGDWGNKSVGHRILDYLENSDYSEGVAKSNLGTHWTTDPRKAWSGGGGGMSVVISADWDGRGEDPYRTGTGGSYGDEREITLLPGAPVKVNSVKALHPHTQKWHEMLSEPHTRHASGPRHLEGGSSMGKSIVSANDNGSIFREGVDKWERDRLRKEWLEESETPLGHATTTRDLYRPELKHSDEYYWSPMVASKKGEGAVPRIGPVAEYDPDNYSELPWPPAGARKGWKNRPFGGLGERDPSLPPPEPLPKAHYGPKPGESLEEYYRRKQGAVTKARYVLLPHWDPQQCVDILHDHHADMGGYRIALQVTPS